jgi:ubiquinone/menaquinone biosynthesis C-methylase UbiE/biotin operon repressor
MPSIVKSLRSLADPTRLRLLLLLREEELSVAEIQDILGMGQSRISGHLAQLRQSGLVIDRRAGKNIYYKLAGDSRTPAHQQIMALVEAGARELPEAVNDRTALEIALRKRQDKTREYFNKLAGRFGRSYCPGRSWKGLAQMLLTLVPPVVVADLGAGEGMLSQLLAKRAKKVIAVDNSEKMVEFGSNLARNHGFKNLEYRLGDIQNPPIRAGSIDLAIFSQALHHAPSPAKAINASYRILKPRGRILILDLLAHNFEQARDLYADLWLGFSEVELHELLKAAGFENIDVEVVARDPEPPHLQSVFATAIKT